MPKLDFITALALLSASLMAILWGIQGFIYKDSLIRSFINPKFASVCLILLGVMVLCATLMGLWRGL